MAWIRGSITYGLFPTVFFGALGLAIWMIGLGISHQYILSAAVLPPVAIVFAIERLHPEHPEWNRSQSDVLTDALHNLVSQMLLPEFLKVFLLGAMLAAAQWVSAGYGGSLWPSELPLALQLVFAMLFSQFWEYWAHRLAHTWPPLWRLHATHHSPGRLYFFNAGRFHPLDTAIAFIVSTAPLVLLGAPDTIVLLYTVWAGVHGIFQHCNIRLRLGPLNYVFSMAELHRWHHSRVLEEANTNFGNNIIFWDLVFGTFFHPRDRQPPIEVGLSGDGLDFPSDYVGQLLSPIRWKQLHR
jgi:ornithine lipid hydroxylase